MTTDAMSDAEFLAADSIYQMDARAGMARLRPASVALSFWSPPYFVGKSYERGLTFRQWQSLLAETIALHHDALRPGGFMVINIADILCFQDSAMPRIQASKPGARKSGVTREDILEALRRKPGLNRHQLADLLGCSEQTIQRRLENNNVRGGKHSPQTRVQLVGGMLQDWAMQSGLYLYDRRIWVKDPCWQNSRWHSSSYRAVDEFEHCSSSGSRASPMWTARGWRMANGRNGGRAPSGRSPPSGPTMTTRQSFRWNWRREWCDCSQAAATWLSTPLSAAAPQHWRRKWRAATL